MGREVDLRTSLAARYIIFFRRASLLYPLFGCGWISQSELTVSAKRGVSAIQRGRVAEWEGRLVGLGNVRETGRWSERVHWRTLIKGEQVGRLVMALG